MTRILIADKLAPEGAAFLESQEGVEVVQELGLTGTGLARALAGADGAVIRSAVKITAGVLDDCTALPGCRLRGIARAGVGVDNIDLAAATRHGIAVMNSASASTITTAEHAFALMIALARNVGAAHVTMREGGWDRSKFTGAQLQGRTLGIVGTGRIGRTMAERALAFGMTVVGYDPFVNAPTIMDGRVRLVGSFDELIELVDVVSFHVPKTEETAGMLGAGQWARARRGLLVVNAARGGVVDEAALIDALESGACGGAALDVYTSEPPPEDSPLRHHPRILLTPHLGASTVEAQEAVAVDACRALLTYLRGEGLMGAVNAGGLQLDLTDRQQAFADLARRMVVLLRAATERPGLTGVRIVMRGDTLPARADTLARLALAEILNQNLDQPVNVINAPLVAEERNIDMETVIAADHGDDRLTIEVHEHDQVHRVDGAVYADNLPRVTSLDGYAMDMVPAGHMVLLANADEPGRIGVVGQLFGDAGVNIAEMVIGRRTGTHRGETAMMIIRLDDPPTDELLAALRVAPGILSATEVTLPPVDVPAPSEPVASL